jgi:serine/threonine protein phosphatase 1
MVYPCYETDVIRRLPRNVVGRDWVVGDIHGCFTTLEALLRDVGFDRNRDRLLSVGDLVDRGPESARALEFWTAPWFYAIRGNHEQMMLDTAAGDTDVALSWTYNGGNWFYEESEECRRALVAAASRLPLVIEVDSAIGHVGLVHADVPKRRSWNDFLRRLERGEKAACDAALWGRERAVGRLRHGVEGIARLYVGHTPQRQGVRIVGNVYCIDTGAVYGPRDGLRDTALSLMQIDDDRVYTREAVYPPDRCVSFW